MGKSIHNLIPSFLLKGMVEQMWTRALKPETDTDEENTFKSIKSLAKT